MAPARRSRGTGRGRGVAPRHASARPEAEGDPVPSAAETVERRWDGDWVVRRITGSSSTKTYRCPGCQQEIRPATPHVVAWPTDAPLLGGQAVDGRRHWHTRCWESGRRPR